MIKLKWLGQRLPKVVELPVPLLSRSEKTGEVICNPIGEFPDEAALILLGTPEYWERVEESPVIVKVPVERTIHAPSAAKMQSNLTLWRERERAKKQYIGPSQPLAEGSTAPSPDQEGALEVV